MSSEQEKAFYTRMETLIGAVESEKLLTSLKEFPLKSVRYNSNQTNAEDLSGEEIPWCAPYGRIWDAAHAPSADLGYLAGQFYIQERSAMLAVALASAHIEFAGKKILDMCAAPGGKTTQAAELAADGLVVANEVIKSRIDPLIWNVVRHRLTNTVVTSEDSEKLASELPGYFDIVIVDAPCSGEGLFQKKKNTMAEWSEKNVLFCAARQETILLNAARCLKSGGYLIYSTCTFAEEENENQVELLLKNGFEPVNLIKEFSVSAAISDNERVRSCARRIFPHREGGAGAFAAVLQKQEESGDFYSEMVTGSEKFSAQHELLPAELPVNSRYYTKNQIISRLDYSELPDYLYHRARQIGLPVLNTQKYSEAMQGMISLASTAKTVQISQDQAVRFARGEDLRMEHDNGWYFVACGTLLLGFAKFASGRAVNKLPNPLLQKS